MAWETGVGATALGLLFVAGLFLAREVLRLRDRVARLEIMRERNGLK